MAKAPKTTPIAKTITKGRQGVIYREMLSVDGKKLRIDIESDSHAFQSHARIEIYNPTELKWNNLASIHYAAMKTPAQLYYSSAGMQEHNFTTDRNELLRQAFAIIL